jgi:hypothetical protein
MVTDGNDPLSPPQRLQEVQYETRSFELDVLKCEHCGGRRKLIAMITDAFVARRSTSVALKRSLGGSLLEASAGGFESGFAGQGLTSSNIWGFRASHPPSPRRARLRR